LFLHRAPERVPSLFGDRQPDLRTIETPVIDEFKGDGVLFERIDSKKKLVADIPQAENQPSA